jgi:hypothetical protein
MLEEVMHATKEGKLWHVAACLQRLPYLLYGFLWFW